MTSINSTYKSVLPPAFDSALKEVKNSIMAGFAHSQPLQEKAVKVIDKLKPNEQIDIEKHSDLTAIKNIWENHQNSIKTIQTLITNDPKCRIAYNEKFDKIYSKQDTTYIAVILDYLVENATYYKAFFRPSCSVM